MARLHINDKLQNFRFHLLDISYNSSGVNPLAVFSPIAGFTSISSPEFTLETEEIQDGVSLFKYDLKGKVSVSPITLTKGVAMMDAGFWRWFVACATRTSFIRDAVMGVTGSRRNLLLIQFTNYGIDAIPGLFDTFAQISSATAGFIPNFQGFAKVPGKAWILSQCLPTRYKPTSDFDASSGDISISELEVKPHLIEELTWI